VAVRAAEARQPSIKPAAVIVQQGKVLDYIDGITQRNETPEEYVRQEIAKSLVREYSYEKQKIAVEFVLRLGSRRPRADLVVFDEGDPRSQARARVILECKSQKIKSTDRKEGAGQLQSYMAACPNVAYGMWTNGVERFCYRRVDTAGKVAFEEIPDIPGKGRTEDEVERPRFDQLKAASSDALLFAFRRCHNYIAGNQGLQNPEAFWELLKIIFCKIHDERGSDEVEFYATSKERHGLNGQLKAKKRIDSLFDEVKAEYPIIFRANEVIELSPPVLSFIVSQLQMYSLLESDIDVKGRAYEEIVGSNLRGDRGEFFTPRNIRTASPSIKSSVPSAKSLTTTPFRLRRHFGHGFTRTTDASARRAQGLALARGSVRIASGFPVVKCRPSHGGRELFNRRVCDKSGNSAP